jgi:hypothetical protein
MIHEMAGFPNVNLAHFSEFAKAGANTFFVPILTSDGKVGMNTTDENSSKVHRDRRGTTQRLLPCLPTTRPRQ